MFRAFLLILLIRISGISNAQSISGIVNRYTAVTAIDTCLGMLLVTDTSGFKKGDAILLIQMQGAIITAGNNSSYGNIQSLNGAGSYERAVLDSVGAGAFFLQHRLLNRYNPAGKIQAIRIATYQSVTVTDTIFAKPWNGQTGGILALEVIDTLALDAPLLADGAGFRGGAASVAPGNNCNFLIPETGYFYAAGNWRGSNKGEGVALPETGKELGRGPQANGGGGGNDHNAGGGGGAHIGRGGTGGENDEPSSFGCDGYYPGIGGYKVSNDPLRLFPGGGGGAGHANNILDGNGGNGGGIIVVSAGVITGTQALISANGRSAKTAEGDGGGGGGAGGSIWLKAESAPQNLQVSADGGNGGNTSNNNSNRCFGPGGGGSGGRILTNLSGIDAPSGGQAGIVTNSTNGCNGASNNAGAGENGQTDTIETFPQGLQALQPDILTDTRPDTVCTDASAQLYVETNEGNWTFQWQRNDGGGWQDIPVGTGFSGFQSDTLVLNSASPAQDGSLFRVRIRRPGCFEIFSGIAQLTVAPAPTAAFSATLSGEVAVFDNLSTNADAYYWDFGDGQFDNETNPQHTYTTEGNYTVTLTVFNACDTIITSQQISILLLPDAGFAGPDSVTACGPASVSFENQSSENSSSFEWQFSGGMPENSTDQNPVVVYGMSGNYVVTLVVSNSAGADTSIQTIQVQILDFPVAHFDYTALPGGVVEVVNTSEGVAGFTWDFGDGSPLVEADSTVSHLYSATGDYTITLVASNACGASVFQQTVHVEVGGVGTTDVRKNGSIWLYPNPAEDYVMIDCSLLQALPEHIEIMDATGRSVFSKYGFSELKPIVHLHDLPAGVYLVQVRTGDELGARLFIRSEK